MIPAFANDPSPLPMIPAKFIIQSAVQFGKFLKQCTQDAQMPPTVHRFRERGERGRCKIQSLAESNIFNRHITYNLLLYSGSVHCTVQHCWME